MVDILHRVGVKSDLNSVYDTLATIDGLAGWWTTSTSGDSTVGGIVEFRFGDAGGSDMRVRELEPAKRVLWEVVAGPDEWVGTTISFDLKQEDDYTIVLFNHQGWREPVEFMHHCGTTWAKFLMSLKQLVETGKGAPYPDDVSVGNW
ncbi:activator of Hsp90 ATPase-like protein [Herbihabitans rhizosphaerae]|uniref:Activator of Hsp90 ATPase-like protein n=1 Tax=Herbihabitans rhizosphaerae TaxID=1872711 RepID=A0A4Q7L2F6_9PSEU|nr:SRPBCC domain-containing protein [Herbihabitans rhizosphaerae]RZS43729.1 activator of Hsp90 ATPase-like protein [Herbihabitans rhizosphaerae]